MSRGIFAVVLFLGGLLPATLQAQEYRSEPPYGIRDEANLFTQDARITAYTDYILPAHNTAHKDIFIETRKSGPNVSESEFRRWADAQAQKYKINGVYILITEQPHKIEIVQDRATLEEGWFVKANADEEFRILKHWLINGKPDSALLKGLDYVKTTLHEHAQTNVTRPQNQWSNPTPSPAPAPAPTGWFGGHWLGFLCLGIGALLLLWMIFGIIRGMSTYRGGGGYGGGPGYGAYGGGYGPGYGGGGGFLSSLMGGMFGAAAGNWMYNNWFGGPHTSSTPPPSYNPPPSQGGGPDYTATGGDWSSPSSPPDEDRGAGGDWGGGDAGSGDAGGGDWGGGDAGAGGDWGGGDAGGDGGGGAGGDW
jgi:uncharacterized protein